MKTRLGLAVGLGLIAAAGSAAQAQRVSPVPVFVNGGRLDSNALLLRNVGRSVLPMRTLFESLGARVEWDASQRAVYAWKDDGAGIRLGVGETSAQRLRMSRSPGPGDWGSVTGSQPLDAPAMMVDGRIFVPLRFASESLSADVRYASAEPAVYIRTQDGSAPEPGDEEPAPRPRPRPRPNPGGGRDNAREVADSLKTELVVEAGRVDRDDRPMRFTFTITNTSNRAVTVPFRSGQRYDFEVLQEEKVLWNWARERSFTQALTNLRLGPGEEAVFNGRWDFRDNDGQRVAPGRYMVRAILTTAFRRPQIMTEKRLEVTR